MREGLGSPILESLLRGANHLIASGTALAVCSVGYDSRCRGPQHFVELWAVTSVRMGS